MQVLNGETQMQANAVTTFDGVTPELFVATTDPETQELVTMEFYEQRPDLGIIDRLNRVNWDVVVPESASLFAATSGHKVDVVGTFWTGWRTTESLRALSLYRKRPVTVDVGPNDTLIDPAVTQPNGQMVQYFWRAREQGSALFSHVFRAREQGRTLFGRVFPGERGEPGTVETRRLLRTATQPVLSTVTPVPGDTEGRVVVAWVERDEDGVTARAVLLGGENRRRLASRTVRDTAFLSDQRLALLVDPDAMTARLGGVVERGEGHTGVFEAEFDFPGEETAVDVTSFPRSTEAPLHAAQVFYYKRSGDDSLFAGLLDEAGTLGTGKPGETEVSVIRRAVPLSYDFPVLTSVSARYETTGTGDGEVDLVPFY